MHHGIESHTIMSVNYPYFPFIFPTRPFDVRRHPNETWWLNPKSTVSCLLKRLLLL